VILRSKELVIGIVEQCVHQLALKQRQLRTDVNRCDMLLQYLVVFVCFFSLMLMV